MSADFEDTNPFDGDRVRSLHLELTDRCNASCPMCSRNEAGGNEQPFLRHVELTLPDIKRMITAPVARHLDLVFACGNVGDPITARDCLPIFRYLRDLKPELRLRLHTNGGARNQGWWQELATILRRGSGGDGDGKVVFGIDGLSDTNHVYRRGVRWETLVGNVSSFINAGGAAEWDFIVFRHNEHQIDEARELASRMGFVGFSLKTTSRFMNYRTMRPTRRQAVVNRAGATEYYIAPPRAQNLRNASVDRLSEIDDVQQRLGGCRIRCKAVEERSAFISCTGHVVPCCWIGNQLLNGVDETLNEMVARSGGEDALDGRRHGIEGVMAGQLFRDIARSWKHDMTGGRLKVCARICGEGVEQNSSVHLAHEVLREPDSN